MKKAKMIVVMLLMTLTACGGKMIETEGFGNFKLPEGFSEFDTGEVHSIRYSDENEEGYFGNVLLTTYVFPENFPDINSYATFMKDEFIVNYGNRIFGKENYSVPSQSEMEVDGHRAFKTVISGNDQYKVEIIDIEIQYADGEKGFIEVIIDYNGKKYPDLAEDFMKSYQRAKSE